MDPIITIDASGIVQSASNSVHRVFGWTPSELIGQSVSVLMPEPHRAAHGGYIERYLRTGHATILNRPRRVEAVRKNGARIPIEICVSRAESPSLRSPIFVGVIRTLSDREPGDPAHEREHGRLEALLARQSEELQLAHLRLRMADRMASIGTLGAGLGHDMNNVLFPVRAHLNALAAGLRQPDARRHIVAIRRGISYLQHLTDSLHYLALDPDRENMESATDLHHWWRQTGAILSKAVPRHVLVTTSIPAGLPKVAVAPHRLTQAMLNLIVNAGEAIPAARKRIQGRVVIKAEPWNGGAGVRLTVTDNGLGMPEEVQRRAFEMFFTTKPRGLGTGLGLPMVRRVVDKAGGTIELQSEPGKGTSVVIVLPAMSATASHSRRTEAAIAIRDGRVAAVVRHFLEVTGARVSVAGGPGRAAVWVLDPRAVPPSRAARWRTKFPKASLVLLGNPPVSAAAAWRTLAPLIIKDPSDLAEVRAMLKLAMHAP